MATPHGGGIAIAVTWFFGISYLFYKNDIDSSLYYALLVGVVISAISYFDDLHELSAKFRLLTQSLVAMFGLYMLGGLGRIDFYFLLLKTKFLQIFLLFYDNLVYQSL